MALIQGQPGEVTVAEGVAGNLRLGRLADLIVSELQGRFYENAFRNRLFSAGMTLNSINNVTFTSATLGVTCTPIWGIWNPITSTINAVILQVMLGIAMTAASNTGCGPFVWAASTGNTGTLGNAGAPWNRKTLSKPAGGSGAQAQNVTGVAITGLTNNLVVMHASALTGGSAANYSQVDTAVGFNPPAAGTSVENLDGSFIVPPGGVLALLATTTPVAHSAASAGLWAEVPTG